MGEASILEQIIAYKGTEVAAAKLHKSLADLERQFPVAATLRQFQESMRAQIEQAKPAVIAEIKKASPSRGLIREHFDPVQHAIDYQNNGATCLSILTDEKYFQGSNDYLQQARAACRLPVLRKDFIIDRYQIAESRVLGADCILLIVAALNEPKLQELAAYANEIGIDILVEVHNREELQRALAIHTDLIGINNRNLHSFQTSLQTTLDLIDDVPEDKLLITESGIQSAQDVNRMLAAGVYGFLVGESCMHAANPGEKLKELMFDGAAEGA